MVELNRRRSADEGEAGTGAWLLLSAAGVLSEAVAGHWLGEPRIGGREGGVKRPPTVGGGAVVPPLDILRGDDRGELGGQQPPAQLLGGDTVHDPAAIAVFALTPVAGGELPHAEPALLPPLLVRLRRWCCDTIVGGGVPIENWICGGDIDTTSGGGGCCAIAIAAVFGCCCGWTAELGGGAETRRDLTGNCLLGDRGDEAGEEESEVVRGRRKTAELATAAGDTW